jgi:hypothetical protein
MAFLNRFIHNKKLIIGLWCSVIFFVFVKHTFLSTPSNNYLIFKYTYVHAVDGENMYWRHPHEYDDKNHYGPIFSLVFAPFAILPDALGELFYIGASVLLLLWAIYCLPIKEWQKNVMLLICLNELLTAGFNVQFNISVAAIILFTYVLIIREKEFFAPLPMLIGTFVKLYGIVGLAFFFFVKNKPKFIVGCVAWSIVLFLAPMILSSPDYVVSMYKEWFLALVAKNGENISLVSYQDFSVMGFVRRIFGDSTIPNLPFLIGGVGLFGLPYLRFSQYKNRAFQLLLVASTLMFPVLFSSSSEGATYIIVFVGIALWFVIQPQPYRWHHWVLLGGVIFFASLNSTDLYPKEFRDYLRLHAFKAFPCALVWLRIIYEMLTKDFSLYQYDETLPKLTTHQHANHFLCRDW